MYDDVNNSVVSIAKFIGILSIVSAIVAIIYFIVYPIYNGDFLILSEISVKCLGALIAGYAGYAISMVIACLGELANDVKAIRRVYEFTYQKVEEHETKKDSKKKTQKMELPKREKVEKVEKQEKPEKLVTQKKKLTQKVADLLLEEEDTEEENIEDDDFIEID